MQPHPAQASLSRLAESRQLQDQLGEKSYTAKLSDHQAHAKFTLEAHQAQRTLNADLLRAQDNRHLQEEYWSTKKLNSSDQENFWSQKRIENSRQQAQWLEKTSLEKKQDSLRNDPNFSRTPDRQDATLARDIRQASSPSASHNTSGLPSKKAPPQLPSLGSPNRTSQAAPTVTTGNNQPLFHPPSEVAPKPSSGSETSATWDGTRLATKEPPPMPSFWNSPHNNTREHRRAWAQPDEASTLNEISNPRHSALVGQPQSSSYNETSVRQALMPRLQELVNRLSQMGHAWARVVVPVDSRTQVVVRFHNQSGRVKIHLSTPSEELCRMINNSWAALVGDAAQRGITLEEPSFDTHYE